MPFNFGEIKGVRVFLEGISNNSLVGVLRLTDDRFLFEYDDEYLRSPKALSLGPEMPLTRKKFEAKDLFRPFLERIPLRDNPAYPEYCKMAGISSEEKNPLILLSTIGSRGPSSFLFKPIWIESFSAEDLKRFRQELGFTIREFALCFDFSEPGLSRVETGDSGGREILKRAEIYAKYPQVALDQLRRREGFLHHHKIEKAKKFLSRF